MAEVRRFFAIWNEEELEDHPDGDLVLWQDYEELKAEREASCEAVAQFQRRGDAEQERGNRLEEELGKLESAARALLGARAGHPSRPSAQRTYWDQLREALDG